MKRILISGLLLLAGLRAGAQATSLASGGCATVTTPQEIQAVRSFVQYGVLSKTTAAPDTLPITVHIVGTNTGGGYYSADNLFTVLCRLNEHYAPTGFYFGLKWPIDTINNTAYYDHADFSAGVSMMNANNVAGTINVYFVSNPAGACGYYAPSGDAVAIAISCAGGSSTTLTHELGHYFGLPHTFYGWEGGQTPWNPEMVRRGVGSNCSVAGDGFCDTDADYLSERWSCPYAKPAMYDINGDLYHPDSSLYMAYSTDNCMSRFSPMQMAFMRSRLQSVRSDLLAATFPAYSALDTPRSALRGDSLWTGAPVVRWRRVPGAERYRVRLAPASATGYILQSTITADTFLRIDQLFAGSEYQCIVEPLSSVNLCRQKTGIIRFTGTDRQPTSVETAATGSAASFSLSPNPATASGWNLQADYLPAGVYTLRLTTIDGRLLQAQTQRLQTGPASFRVSPGTAPEGLYLIHLEGPEIRNTFRAVLSR